MNVEEENELTQRLGVDRVIDPPGVLPQPADRLDPAAPARPFEFELAVERLCLDSTSFRNIRERSDDDPERMGRRILEIVGERGKMHNPETDSGGVLVGRVSAVGERFPSPPVLGARVVTLASLTLTPLRLDAVTRLDPGSPQVEVTGAAYVCERAPWALVPDDLPLALALEVFDVYSAGSHVRALAPDGGTVCVLGAGHAGKLALAAARDSMTGGTLVAVDVDREAVERVTELGLCDIGVAADLHDPLAALEAMRAAGAPPADLTVVVVNSNGCEPAAILLTAAGGTVLFFSMATSFATAALSSDGLRADVSMLIGSGYGPDMGAYALDLVRNDSALREALEGATVGAA